MNMIFNAGRQSGKTAVLQKNKIIEAFNKTQLSSAEGLQQFASQVKQAFGQLTEVVPELDKNSKKAESAALELNKAVRRIKEGTTGVNPVFRQYKNMRVWK